MSEPITPEVIVIEVLAALARRGLAVRLDNPSAAAHYAAGLLRALAPAPLRADPQPAIEPAPAAPATAATTVERLPRQESAVPARAEGRAPLIEASPLAAHHRRRMHLLPDL